MIQMLHDVAQTFEISYMTQILANKDSKWCTMLHKSLKIKSKFATMQCKNNGYKHKHKENRKLLM